MYLPDEITTTYIGPRHTSLAGLSTVLKFGDRSRCHQGGHQGGHLVYLSFETSLTGSIRILPSAHPQVLAHSISSSLVLDPMVGRRESLSRK
jgi:hypothetical protein